MTATVPGPAVPGFAHRSPLGPMTVESLGHAQVVDQAALLHAWVTHPRSAFWLMQGATREAVVDEYLRIAADPHHDAWLGRLRGEPLFLVESYDPAHSELAEHYAVAPGDVGMHLLVAPPPPGRPPRHGLTSAVMRAVMSLLFADERCRRVVVEPDERNARIAAKNAEAGFVVERRVRLAAKVAVLSTCRRADFAASPLGREPR